MFGWEFPPVMSGGLGTACFGLTKAMARKGFDVTFVMPHGPMNLKGEFVKLLVADALVPGSLKIRKINSLLVPYISSADYEQRYKNILEAKGTGQAKGLYGKDLFQEVQRFAAKALLIAESEDFDIIHAHDWMTYPAGLNAKAASGKPLVVHVHATEFDRTGGNGVNQYVYDIERKGMHEADLVLAVSNHTKHIIMQHYGVPEYKIRVVHNAVEFPPLHEEHSPIKQSDRVVLFLGRVTLQKGPDYFIEAAKRVLDHIPNVKFVLAGSGDMTARMIDKAAYLGIGSKVLFTGFLSGADVDKAYRMADLYVMPSVSEPFGITPLEAMRNGTPVIISKQSGCSEVLHHCLKVDFWDVQELANKIMAALQYSQLHRQLKEEGLREVHTFSWDVPAEKCIAAYHEVLCRAIAR